MTYFTKSTIFLVPSFELDVKESEKIDKFLLFLENSQVGNVIAKYVKNNTSKGGRPNCNYYRLFAAILFGFAFDKTPVQAAVTQKPHDALDFEKNHGI